MKQKLFTLLLSTSTFLFVFSNVQSVFAAQTPVTVTQTSISDQVYPFLKYFTVSPKVTTTTVVQIPFDDYGLAIPHRPEIMMVVDTTTSTIEGINISNTTVLHETEYSLTTDDNTYNASLMHDSNLTTYKSFPVSQDKIESATIYVNSKKPFSTSSITFSFDKNVIRPKTIAITTNTSNGSNTVLAQAAFTSDTILFPTTTASSWAIKLSYDQPLRITELKLNQTGSFVTQVYNLRFLVKPHHVYAVYYDLDTDIAIATKEAGNIATADEVLKITNVTPQNNPYYKEIDRDGDGIPDSKDNCVAYANPDQKNENNNGRGDICEDFDYDGKPNNFDNCPNDPNFNQSDADGDGIGDICDKIESRFTEAYPWIPWVGIGFAGVVLIALFAMTAREGVKK